MPIWFAIKSVVQSVIWPLLAVALIAAIVSHDTAIAAHGHVASSNESATQRESGGDEALSHGFAQHAENQVDLAASRMRWGHL